MSKTERFRTDHANLLAIAQQITALLNKVELERDASAVRPLLSKFVGNLKVHLAMEDHALYPELANSEDLNVRTTAIRFKNEMGDLKSVVDAYAKRWDKAPTIQANALDFIQETKKVFAALAKRIDKEDNELYPMADNVAQARKSAFSKAS